MLRFASLLLVFALSSPAAAPRAVSFDFAHEAVSDDLSHRDARFESTTYRIRDLWSKRDLGTTARPLAVQVGGHDVVMVRLTK